MTKRLFGWLLMFALLAMWPLRVSATEEEVVWSVLVVVPGAKSKHPVTSMADAETVAAELNGVHETYEGVHPWFTAAQFRQQNVIAFGWRGEVRGLRANEFPRMRRGLEREFGDAKVFWLRKAHWEAGLAPSPPPTP